MYRLPVALVLSLATCSSPAFASRAALVHVPAGTQIKMYVAGEVDSERVRPGDPFEAQVATDVVVDGSVVVRKGAQAEGTIRALKAGRGTASAEALVLAFDWVAAADGTKIAVTTQNAIAPAREGAQPAKAPQNLNAFGLAGYFAIVSVFAKNDAGVKIFDPGMN